MKILIKKLIFAFRTGTKPEKNSTMVLIPLKIQEEK